MLKQYQAKPTIAALMLSLCEAFGARDVFELIGKGYLPKVNCLQMLTWQCHAGPS